MKGSETSLQDEISSNKEPGMDNNWIAAIVKAIASLFSRSKKQRRIINYKERETTKNSRKEKEFTYWEEHTDTE